MKSLRKENKKEIIERCHAIEEKERERLELIYELEFFMNPQGWLTRTEHPCLDG
jgi:hypothetical protein